MKPRTSPGSTTELASALTRLLVAIETGGRVKARRVAAVEVHGRELRVQLKTGARPAVSDRTTLVNLFNAVWTVKETPYMTTFWFPDEPLHEYIFELSRISKLEAKAVFQQLQGGLCDLPFPAEHKLAGLFDQAPFAQKHLNEAASAGALIKRCWSHARKGRLSDRIAAIGAILNAISSAAHHRDAADIYEEAHALATSLQKESVPLLKEAGWMLAEEHAMNLQHYQQYPGPLRDHFLAGK